MDTRGPLYRNIEFCRSAETLWRKLKSGHWDWLGVHPKGQFVLGSPKVQVSQLGSISTRLVSPDAKEGVHGVRHEVWNGSPGAEPSSEWYSTAEEARNRYQVILEEFKSKSPLLARVSLIEDKWVAEEEFIANIPPPNYQ
jgi:hypothetical protein